MNPNNPIGLGDRVRFLDAGDTVLGTVTAIDLSLSEPFRVRWDGLPPEHSDDADTGDGYTGWYSGDELVRV